MSEKKENWFEQFQKLFRPEKFSKELQETLQAVQKDPKDLKLKIRLGEVYFKRRELDKGVDLFKQVAEEYTKNGFLLKAVAIYKSVIQMVPSSVEFNEKLIDIYHQLGMSKDAIIQCLITINYYQNHQMKEKVIQTARKMVEVDPQNASNRIRLAEIYFNQGFEEEALKQYEEIGQQLKAQDSQEINLLIDVLEKLFFKRPKDKLLLQEICTLQLKRENPQGVVKRIEKYKWNEEPEMREVYQRALQMLETTASPL